MALDEMLEQQERADQASAAQEERGDLVVVEGRLEAIQKDQAMRAILELGIAAGRTQTTRVFSQMADAIAISQLRRIKEMAKAAGIPWAQACNMAGFSSKTADQYLRIANDLGDDFVADVSRLGVSIRTLEAARQLPEPVRRALASGEVVDLEAVTKEALTDAIRTLASEHASEKKALQDELKKAVKAQDKAIDKGADLAGQVENLKNELEALKEGLPADDKKALERLQAAERPIIAHLALVKNTLDIEGRDPGFVARLVSGLQLIEVMARLTVSVVMARAEGLEPNPEALEDEAQGLNEDIAHHDGRAPHPGV